MATQIYQVTDAPVNLIGANDIDGNEITLSVGTTYSGRYVSDGRAILSVLASATAPTADHAALPVYHREDMIIVPVNEEGIYVWSDSPIGIVVINEVP